MVLKMMMCRAAIPPDAHLYRSLNGTRSQHPHSRHMVTLVFVVRPYLSMMSFNRTATSIALLGDTGVSVPSTS